MADSSAKSSKDLMLSLSTIDINSSVAVYAQIENNIQFAIASGKLNAGDQLPSVRELSERLEVNPNTVAKSYRDLEVMGLLNTRRGMGVFVAKGVENKCRDDVRKKVVDRVREVVSEARCAGFTKEELIDLADRCYTMNLCPYSETPAALLATARKRK